MSLTRNIDVPVEHNNGASISSAHLFDDYFKTARSEKEAITVAARKPRPSDEDPRPLDPIRDLHFPPIPTHPEPEDEEEH